MKFCFIILNINRLKYLNLSVCNLLYAKKDERYEKRKIELLKIIDDAKNNNASEDYGSLNRRGFDNSFIRVMINEGLIGFSGVDFYLTDKGEQKLKDYKIIEAGKKKKIKIMFDSNIFDYILGDNELLKILEEKEDDFKFYITHVQYDEINNCPDAEKRAKLTLSSGKLRPVVIPTESLVLGKSRLGFSRLGKGDVLEKIRGGKPKETMDALIGETAIKNHIILVTNDRKLRKRVNSSKGKAISLEEFKKMVLSNTQI